MIDLATAIQAFVQATIDLGKTVATILEDFVNCFNLRTIRRMNRMVKLSIAREEVRNSDASGRIKHLALYARKKRVRSKNLNRIRRNLK